MARILMDGRHQLFLFPGNKEDGSSSDLEANDNRRGRRWLPVLVAVQLKEGAISKFSGVGELFRPTSEALRQALLQVTCWNPHGPTPI
jgi:hypothetical protein